MGGADPEGLGGVGGGGEVSVKPYNFKKETL